MDRAAVVRRVELYCDPTLVRGALADAFHTEVDKIPSSFSGTVQAGTLYVVSSDIYRSTFVRLYGEARWTDAEYENLMTHELIHSADELVAKHLFGTEEGMGPPWVFEGLAIEGSGQFPIDAAELKAITSDEFARFLESTKRNDVHPPVYVQYGKYIRYALQFVSRRWIVENAGTGNLERELLKRCREEGSVSSN